jgi:hypothetical protein
MAVYEVSVPAATAVVGADLLATLPYARVSGGGRVLRSAGVAGSAAALDTRVGILIGGVKVGQLFNGATGGVSGDRDMTDFGDAWVPPGESLAVLVEDAAATNPINLRIVIEEMVG